MAIFKCKMCGGSLEIGANQMTAVCEYCGTKQTLPKLDDDRRANLYDRANHFRRNNEYDKAMGIYEQILNEDTTDAEAYWSLVLCRFGIEYVEDPTTHKRVPTVNRAQFGAVSADADYKSAVANADAGQKTIYEAEAQAIDEIQKGILAISQKEEPFDVFICYKETDANGRRTPDSVLATELYHELTKEGFKVFFSRITLEDILGTAYEPYIFAALNSAKVMVAIGTKSEYFNAVWVKNEWSRYLTLVKQPGSKKVLIPAFKDMDPYDLPEELSHLQAQDMLKLGFMQDLIRGIKKLAASPSPIKQEEPVRVQTHDELKEFSLEDGLYVGEGIAGQPHGKGKLICKDGSKYEGEWKFGKKEGQGTYTWEKGGQWTGEYKDNGMWNGSGRIWEYDGYFEGSLVSGDRNQGTYTYDKGGQWTGEWKDGKMWNGSGRIWNDDGYFEGSCVSGKPEGQGTYTWNKGGQWTGEYKDGKVWNGKGRIWYSNGSYCEGTLVDGEFLGAGIRGTNGKIKEEANFYKNSKSGCYVATCIYGSYDCPQVWTLRRFRDYTLAKTWYGRAFICAYYAISPTLVKWFGHTNWFKKMWQSKLNRIVSKLQYKGVESTPYEDKKYN